MSPERNVPPGEVWMFVLLWASMIGVGMIARAVR
jgi:hypothetical protein